MSLLIRRATNRDSDDVVRVIRAVYDEYGFTWEEGGYHADLYDIEGAYDACGDRFFVAEWDGKVVGTAAIEWFDAIAGDADTLVEYDGYWRIAGTDCSLERLYVHPDGRRKGIGQALLRHIVQAGVESGRTKMEIWSDKRFTDAHRLYERAGAKVVGDRICDDPDESPEWGLCLPLDL